jgi:hypothetical protein
VCRAKIGTWSLSWLFVLSGCSAILADQASEGVLAFDPGSEIDGLAGFLQLCVPKTSSKVMRPGNIR